jgi:hypothetical protein
VVKTKFFDNASAITLPPTSLYAPVAEEINIVQSGEVVGNGAQDVDDFAGAVVRNTLKGSPTLIPWLGGSSFIIWAVDTFLWVTFFISIAQCFIYLCLFDVGSSDCTSNPVQNTSSKSKDIGCTEV